MKRWQWIAAMALLLELVLIGEVVTGITIPALHPQWSQRAACAVFARVHNRLFVDQWNPPITCPE